MLTERGEKAFQKMLNVQQNIRLRLFEGLTQEDYDRTINVLKNMIDNKAK